MNSDQIEKNVGKLVDEFSKQEFIFDLLLAYGTPKSTVTRLKKGSHNLSKKEKQIILKKRLFFVEVEGQDLHVLIDDLKNDDKTMRHSPRFIIATDYSTILAIDTKTSEQLDVPIESLAKHFAFFLPWAGIEKYEYKMENPADRKAAEKMAKLYDHILQDNEINDEKQIHDLNIFLSRLLFCFFAEDTEIFEDTLFTSSIASHTLKDGSDLNTYLAKLFELLNAQERSEFAAHFQKFPYVNGGLFAKKHWVPKFSKKAREIIIECGELDWAQINPDIFGSMIQAVVHPSQRGSLGMHYTSVPNIMKVIEPLFLNDLKGEFEGSKGNEKKLYDLIGRISKIKFFDPACGSGNFLIITYKELRKLEMQIIEGLGAFSLTSISLNQFYGIEIDDFAHEVAKLSLYLAEHQMNVQFKEQFGHSNPTLPLKESGNIVCANATRVDWNEVCPSSREDEVYIFGNPPYLGQRNQNKHHQDDMVFVFKGYKNFKNLDYVSIWFFKACTFIKTVHQKIAFVTTNSICQGTQVEMLWSKLFSMKAVDIFFAYPSIKWGNNATNSASVTCSIIGLELNSHSQKIIFTDHAKTVQNISPYLTEGGRTIISPRRGKPLSSLPPMVGGNQPREGGHLFLSNQEKEILTSEGLIPKKFLKKVLGSREFLNGIERWCIWIEKDELDEALKYSELVDRIDKVKKKRINGNSLEKNFIEYSYRFVQNSTAKESQIIIPILNSDKLVYLPVGILNADSVVTNRLNVVFDGPNYLCGILSSRMHFLWTLASSGKFGTQINYTITTCYNSFPLPELTDKQKKDLNFYVYNVLEEREKHPEKTMAQLYDPDKMPEGLKEAHHSLDIAVEKLYRNVPFKNDEERLEYLFKLYEEMTSKDESKQTEICPT